MKKRDKDFSTSTASRERQVNFACEKTALWFDEEVNFVKSECNFDDAHGASSNDGIAYDVSLQCFNQLYYTNDSGLYRDMDRDMFDWTKCIKLQKKASVHPTINIDQLSSLNSMFEYDQDFMAKLVLEWNSCNHSR